MRVPGYQAGRYFELVKEPDALADALTRLPGNKLLLIAFVDARSGDGYARKYRVLFIDGRLYPVHLAISAEWKVHYFSSDMAERADHRDEGADGVRQCRDTAQVVLDQLGRAGEP